MRKEYNLDTLKVKRKGIPVQLQDSDLERAKVKITISLDKDIIDFFKESAKKYGALPYQTQINQTLRTLLPTSKGHSAIYEKIKQELLQDDSFFFSIKKIIQQRQHKNM